MRSQFVNYVNCAFIMSFNAAALSSANEVKLLMKKIVKMVNFDHPNMMTLIGVILVEGGAPLLVMPCMVKGHMSARTRASCLWRKIQKTLIR